MRKKTENQKTLFLLWIVLGIFLLTIIMGIAGGLASKEMLKNYDKALNSTDVKLIYMGRPTCTYCQQLEPILKDLSSRYNFDYFYLNTDKLSSTQLETALGKVSIDIEQFGTPYLIIMKGGKKVVEQSGLQLKADLFKFLQQGGVIASDAFLTFQNQQMLSDYNETILSNSNKLIYAGGATCSECTAVTSSLNAFKNDYNLDFFTLNYDEMTNSELQTELSKLGVSNINNTTPYVIIAKDGKEVARYTGSMTEKDLFEFVKSYNLIPSDSQLIIEKIGYSSFLSLFNSSEPHIVVIGRVGCGYCEAAYPVLKDMVKKYDITINYLELSYLTNDENTALNNIMADVEGGLSTPNMIIVKDGKVVDNSVGFIDQNTYVKFLLENNMLAD